MMDVQTNVTFDVVIVGGGVIGVMLALELERLHYRVAVIELRAPSFSSGNPERVVALNYGSRCYLEALGLWQDIAAHGLGHIHHIVVSEPGNRGRVDLGVNNLNASDLDTSDMQALGYVVEIGHVLEPMYQRLKASSVELISPASLLNYELQSDRVSLQVQRDTMVSTITAALLVGADGSFSQVRRLAQIDTCGWDYNRFGLVASIACEHGHNDTAHECFRSSGPLAFLPLADGRYSIVWASTPAEATQLLAMDDAAFMSALERAAGADTLHQIGAIIDVSKRASFPLELSIAKTFAKPRIALLGNAAHTLHPVAGQGMNLGLRDVETLVAVLDDDVAKGDAGQSILMQAYAEKRRADVMAVAGFTESMTHIFGSTVPGMKWLRSMGLQNLSSFSGLSKLLLKQASGVGQLSARHMDIA